jgi:hypothetical protein
MTADEALDFLRAEIRRLGGAGAAAEADRLRELLRKVAPAVDPSRVQPAVWDEVRKAVG